MTASYTVLEAAVVSGDKIDMEELTYGGHTRKRTRMVMTGTTELAIADVVASDPASSAYGLSVRVVPGYDILTGCTSTLITVPLDTSTLLLAANANRKRMRFMSVDDDLVWLHFGAGPAAEGGSWNLAQLLRRADGGTEMLTFNAYEEPTPLGQLWRGAVYGYAPTSGGGVVVVTEWT